MACGYFHDFPSSSFLISSSDQIVKDSISLAGARIETLVIGTGTAYSYESCNNVAGGESIKFNVQAKEELGTIIFSCS